MGNLIILAVLFSVIFFIFKIYQQFQPNNNTKTKQNNDIPTKNSDGKEINTEATEFVNMKFSMLTVIRITAVIMLLICIYNIYIILNLFSYTAGRPSHRATGVVSVFLLFQMIFYACGMVVSISMYICKSWSRWPTLAISYFFLITSLISLYHLITDIVPINYHITKAIDDTVEIVLSLWCFYYFNRSDVKVHFK